MASCKLDASYTASLPIDKDYMRKYFNENT